MYPGPVAHQPARFWEQVLAVLADGYIRLSVGLENLEDILADLQRALKEAIGL